MNAINKIENFLFRSPTWKFILALFLLTFLKTGIWAIPNLWVSQIIAQNPFINPFYNPNTHYLFWSWLGPFLAWLLNATSAWKFFAFHLLFSIAFSMLFIRTIFKNLANEHARISLIIFFSLPASATAYFWVSPDSITLFLMLLALAFHRWLIFTFITGALLGMQHFEQGFFAALGLMFAVSTNKKQGNDLQYSVEFCLALLSGVMAGKFILFGVFSYYSINVNSGRLYWLHIHLYQLLSQFFFHFQYIIWSVLGLGWLVAIKFSDLGRRSVPFFKALAGLCLLLPITGDQTRVLAIITFPLICVYWLFNQDFLEKLNKPEASVFFVIWLIVPWGWVWDGIPKWSVFPYDLAFLLHQCFGWFDLPKTVAHWPF